MNPYKQLFNAEKMAKNTINFDGTRIKPGPIFQIRRVPTHT